MGEYQIGNVQPLHSLACGTFPEHSLTLRFQTGCPTLLRTGVTILALSTSFRLVITCRAMLRLVRSQK